MCNDSALSSLYGQFTGRSDDTCVSEEEPLYYMSQQAYDDFNPPLTDEQLDARYERWCALVDDAHDNDGCQRDEDDADWYDAEID